MLRRLAVFTFGVPLGLLAMLALWPLAAGPALAGAGALAGALLLAVASWLERRRADDPARGLRLARGAAAAVVAAPAFVAAAAALAPGPAVLTVLCGIWLAVSLVRAARGTGACAPASVALAAAAHAVLGAGLLLGVSALGAGWPQARGEWTEARSRLFAGLSARAPAAAHPDCRQRLAASRVLLNRGAHPRMSPDGEWLWFDAAGPTGRRQIHRMRRSSGRVQCWTCGQPGNNVRPAPGPRGVGVVYDSDRHATWHAPDNTELYLVSAVGDAPPPMDQRLTSARGPDDHAVMAPSERLVIWSRRRAGRYAVVSGRMVHEHAGAILTDIDALHAGGATWTAPLAWSASGRWLVWAAGNPHGPVTARGLDLTTGEQRRLAEGVAAQASAGVSADGGWVVLPTTERAGVAALLPRSLGFAMGPRASASAARRATSWGTGLVSGPSAAELAPLAVDGVATWGAPTGVATFGTGESWILGQRREGAADERLVELTLECVPGAQPRT